MTTKPSPTEQTLATDEGHDVAERSLKTNQVSGPHDKNVFVNDFPQFIDCM